MNFNHHLPTRRSGMFQMTSMVDVVFILLAFFVMASHFRLPERDFSMAHKSPESAAGSVEADDFPADIPVYVRCTSGGGMSIRVGQGELESGSLTALTDALARINMPQLPVRVVADAELTIAQVASVMDAVLASPMKTITIAKLSGPAKGAE